MIPLTDDELGALLTETFTAHEHLADPDHAVAIASSPGSPRHLGRVLLGAAAAVALVAGGTSYAVSQGRDAGPGPSHGPIHPIGPVPPHLTTDAENEATAQHLVNEALTSLPSYPGSRPTELVPELRSTSAIMDIPHYTASRIGYWTADGSASTVAGWYAAHAPAGFRVQGGLGTMNREGGFDTPLIHDVYLVQPGHDLLPPRGVQLVVQTVQLATGVGIRVTAVTIWRPARPAESFVDQVTSIDVHERISHFGRKHRSSRQTWSIESPDQIRSVVTTFNRLPGWPPNPHGCLPIRVDHRYRVLFHTASGDVTVTGSISCYDDLTVLRDGHRVGPYLDHGSELAAVLDAAH
jgi:hypothetical protein